MYAINQAPDPRFSLLRDLVAFDTTSRNSNLDFIDYVVEFLQSYGVSCDLTYDSSGAKANLFATIGPVDRSGIVLSGHTDVVPIDGQDWSFPAFNLIRENQRLYGRGTSDMKGFIAVCLALVPEMLAANLRHPLHLAFSYDEEVGCLGVRHLLDALLEKPVRPLGCLIGEPTDMRIINAHKGKFSVCCTVSGLEGHSGLPHRGVNAVEMASELVVFLRKLGHKMRFEADQDLAFDPPWTTVHTGTIQGGTVLNIIPAQCRVEFEIRCLPRHDPLQLFSLVEDFANSELLPEMQRVHSSAGFEFEIVSDVRSLDTADTHALVDLIKQLAGDQKTGKVSFGTEGGLFSAAGIPAVVCGPGSISQAHKPDEFVEEAQLQRCEMLIRNIIEYLATNELMF